VKKLSVSLRLTLGYLAVFLVAELILGAGTFLLLRQNVFHIADAVLDGQATDLERFLDTQKDLPAAQLQSNIAAHFNIERSRDYLQISEVGGSLIYCSRFLAEHPLPSLSLDDLDRPLYQNRKLGQRRFRFLSKQIEVNGREYVVRIGRPMDQESAALDALRAYLLWFAPLLLLLASIAAYWLSRRALLGRVS